MRLNKSTLDDSRYRFVAEWELHSATWIGWPSNRSDWPGKFSIVKWAFAELILKIAHYERLNILVNDESAKNDAMQFLLKLNVNFENINFVIQMLDRNWMRDIGPIFLLDSNQEKVLIDFHFNGWGKYDNYQRDRKLPYAITKLIDVQYHNAQIDGIEITLEGGAIDTNGRGTLITTEQTLLDQSKQVRNRKFDKEDYRKVFQKYGNIDQIIWLKNGIEGDDTNGHVDDVARFVAADKVVYANEDNSRDINYAALNVNREILESATLADGSKIDLIPLPMPAPLYYDGYRLPASYTNFYILNGLIVVPTFNDPKDKIAAGILQELFNDRVVVGIHAVDLILGLGSIHCLTQQEP
ncbi:MAG: agmatine deiminase family protein [Nitrospinota bacterium]